MKKTIAELIELEIFSGKFDEKYQSIYDLDPSERICPPDEQERRRAIKSELINHLLNGPGEIEYFDERLGETTSIIITIGTVRWLRNGVSHRIGKPAAITSDFAEYWSIDGKYHREDGPAITLGGSQFWYINGNLHRIDGPAVIHQIHYEDRSEITQLKYWVNGKRHREDGPAIIDEDGSYEWYLNGVRHRLGGPAVDKTSGEREFWIYGEQVDEEKLKIRDWLNEYLSEKSTKAGKTKV